MDKSDAPDETLRHQLSINIPASNDVLPDREQHVVRELLVDRQRNVDELDSEISIVEQKLEELYFAISELQKNLGSLNRKRKQELNVIKKLQVAIAPQKRMPTELLAKIFWYCMGETIFIPTHGYVQALALGCVCSRWHGIINEHCLWRRVEVDYAPFIGNTSTACRTACTKAVLERSKNHLFSLKMDLSRSQSSDAAEAIPIIVIPNACRIQHLHLQFFPGTSQEFLNHPPLPFDSLESLDLRFVGFAPTKIDESFDVFSKAPSLRSITLRMTSMTTYIHHVLPHQFDFPWAQLRHISLLGQILPYMTALHTLHDCVNLLTAEIHIGGSTPLSSLEIHANVQRLHSLEVTVHGSHIITPFIQSLTLPSIHTLKVTSYDGKVIPWPTFQFISFLSRSKCALKRFELEDLDLPSQDMENLFWALPSLEELILLETSSYIPASVFDSMLHHGLLPNLQLLDCHFVADSSESVLALLEYRWAGGSTDGYQGIHRGTLMVRGTSVAAETLQVRSIKESSLEVFTNAT
jgi:hypothetical protein